MHGTPGLARTALVGLLVMLALSACGRKGPLEAPAGAAVVTRTPVDPARANGNQGEEARRTAPQKRIPLDILLGK